jgi:acid phosphatase (class A)
MYANVRKVVSFALIVGLLGGCAALFEQTKLPDVGEVRPGMMKGYLDPKVLPDSLTLLPSVPKSNSITMTRDKAMSKESLALHGSKRWELAIKDSQLDFPEAVDAYSCTLGIPISKEETPQIYRLLRRVQTDARLSTGKAKNNYKRSRPFVWNKAPICTPDKKAFLLTNGSFPSGHSAIGWAWALTLAEIDPDHATEILARGRAYSESRVICNVHWYSDIMWGRTMGASTVARLHADPEYQKRVKAAKAELKSVRKKGLKPANDCQFEAEALSIKLY